MCGCAQVSADALRGQRCQISLKLELQAVFSTLI